MGKQARVKLIRRAAKLAQKVNPDFTLGDVMHKAFELKMAKREHREQIRKREATK